MSIYMNMYVCIYMYMVVCIYMYMVVCIYMNIYMHIYKYNCIDKGECKRLLFPPATPEAEDLHPPRHAEP